MKKQGGEVFWVITPSFCIAVEERRWSVSLSLSPLSFFHIFLFWQVPQPPVHGKHTLHILQTRVFREEIERKLCRKCKKSVSPSLFLCLSVAHFTQRTTPCFQFTSNYSCLSLKGKVKAGNNRQKQHIL